MFWRCSSCEHRNLGRHQVCQACHHPKDGSEQYEMPEDTAAAVTVTDEALLRMATAGPNWRCAYCESDQRAFDGGCQNCGASAVEGMSTSEEEETTPPPETRRAANKRKDDSSPILNGCMVLLVLVLFFGGCLPRLCSKEPEPTPAPKSAQKPAQKRTLTHTLSPPHTPSPRYSYQPEELALDAPPMRGPEWTRTLQVKELAWEHEVRVERSRLVEHEGFAEDRPADALDVKTQGSRHHHDERVLDGYDTISYTERVRDGYTSETYQERESCGRDCTTTPKKCTESCKSNKNGFATCKTTCTGGDQRCTTRYCSVTKTRKVPRYVDERRSRQEPRYRTVSREAPWYVWKQREWSYDRTVTANGHTLKTRWPSQSELRPATALGKGEQERHERSASYSVVFQSEEGLAPVTYNPANLREFQRFTPGSRHTLQMEDGRVSVIASKKPKPKSKKPTPKQ
jgi:hypothetical protein